MDSDQAAAITQAEEQSISSASSSQNEEDMMEIVTGEDHVMEKEIEGLTVTGSTSSMTTERTNRVYKRGNNFEESDEEDLGLFEQRTVKIVHEDFETEFEDDFGPL